MRKLIFFLLVVNQCLGQHTNILISHLNDPEEPSIMMDFKNPLRMVAGANLNNVYYSIDGGFSWFENILVSEEYGVWGDPVIAVDTAGDFYFLHLSNPVSGNWIDRIVCQKSTDGGISWNNGTFMGLNGTKAQDKQWISIDRSNNAMYVTWTQFDEYGSTITTDSSSIMFSKSLDAGETWSDAVRINKLNGDCIDDDFTVEGAVPAVGPNGEIYVAWAGNYGIYFDKSTDGGETWLNEDVYVTDMPGGWTFNIPGIYRCNGLPVTVCDTSGGLNNGTIYINWTDQRNGTDDTDVWIVKSTNGGISWSEPIRVNDDEPGKQQFFTWMAIDQKDGTLYFVFYDRRAYDDNQTDVFMARSTDGGETFENFKISETPFVPNPMVFFGDYSNIVAWNGIIRPIWTRLDGTSLSLITAIIDTALVSKPEIFEEQALLEQNNPNPFSHSTFFSFKLHETTIVNLSVYDIYGRKITDVIKNEKLNYGKHKIEFNFEDLKLSSGIYYYSLKTEKKTITRKMIISK
ncbi:MAG: T9SS type A sorting domain-containing protein [Bacteroidales bacterium]|nr:T9SS type A sorting domain-containing protein [Bacteroidales bacterium]